MPHGLTDEEKDLLVALAQPLDQSRRDPFLREVAAEVEAAAGQTGIGPGPGGVHRVARQIQRHFFNPPQLGESKYRA
jgi:hypothetical protein